MQRYQFIVVAILGLLIQNSIFSFAETAKKDEAVKLFEMLLATNEKLTDYQLAFDYKEMDKDGKLGPLASYELLFKKPDYRRLAATGGPNKGYILVYNPDSDAKKVHIKRGILPLPPTSKDDKRLESFFGCDWTSDLNEIKKLSEGGKISLKGKEKISGDNTQMLEIQLKPSVKYVTIKLWIDIKSNILIQYEYYKKEGLFSRKTWKDIKLNTGLKAEDFTLKGKEQKKI